MTGRNDPPKRDRNCGNCLHYLADDDDSDSGECRAHPPTVFYDDTFRLLKAIGT